MSFYNFFAMLRPMKLLEVGHEQEESDDSNFESDIDSDGELKVVPVSVKAGKDKATTEVVE